MSAGRRAPWLAGAALASTLFCAIPATAGEPAPRPGARGGDTLKQALDAALVHYQARRFAEARTGFLRILAASPAGKSRDNLEFNIAACDYELGNFREAEARFARLAGPASPGRGEALIQAGWAALGAGDASAARRYLADSTAAASADDEDDALGTKRAELHEAILADELEHDAEQFASALQRATAAYDAGNIPGAEAALATARQHNGHATPRARAALDYLAGLLARERGDDEAARAALERSLSANPKDGTALALLGELAQTRGDPASAERYYRQSLDADLSLGEAEAVRAALEALFPLPAPGFAAWAALGAGYDSNATQSGSSETVGYALPLQQGSAFAAPAWGVEYRLRSGPRSRLVPYYAGDWLMLSAAELEDSSLQAHELGFRWHFAPLPSLELRLGAGGGATLSGLSLSPFSLDGLLRGRLALRHGASFRSTLSLEARPSIGLSGRDELRGTRTDMSLGERFTSGRWGVSATLGFRYNAIGTQEIAIDPARYPRCNLACNGARYQIPLGYLGPIAGVDADVELGGALELAASARYEHRTYLDASRIDGPVLPAVVRNLSEKTRQDERYTLGARARYRLESQLELGIFLDYALRISRSNVAYRPGDLDHAFDYDDRNFTQHVVELGLEIRR